ncbi:MAG: transcription-repair coupling factor, partial [Acidimicrobiia bacterium]
MTDSPTGTAPEDVAASGALGVLADLIHDDPIVRALAAGGEDVVVVPEVARGIAFAAAVRQRASHAPLVIVTPTSSEAEHLAGQLEVYDAGFVAWYPAWETLPFERVSPNVETMGRREQVRMHLASEQAPDVIVMGVRALTQRVGPKPPPALTVTVAQDCDREALLVALVHFGYRREHQVEARGEFAVRGSIVDIFPSTAAHPVRLDFFGDVIERLSEFGIAEQRSVRDLREIAIVPARELLITDEVIARARHLQSTAPWAQSAWGRLSEGLSFDGMESWLPWLTEPTSILDSLGDGHRLALIDPKRLRDRAADLIAEEQSLANSLAPTWGLESAAGLPSLTLPIEQL